MYAKGMPCVPKGATCEKSAAPLKLTLTMAVKIKWQFPSWSAVVAIFPRTVSSNSTCVVDVTGMDFNFVLAGRPSGPNTSEHGSEHINTCA
jgi:hypothetical protein